MGSESKKVAARADSWSVLAGAFSKIIRRQDSQRFHADEFVPDDGSLMGGATGGVGRIEGAVHDFRFEGIGPGEPVFQHLDRQAVTFLLFDVIAAAA